MATTQNASRTSGRGNTLSRALITLFSLGGFAIAVFLAIRVFGCVEGLEFSPDTFGSRTFIYYEVPLVRVRVSGVYRDDVSGVLARKVGGAKYTPGKKSDPPRWHLVAMTKGGVYYNDDALIVYRYLHSYDPFAVANPFAATGDSPAAEYWLDWTNDHDDLAQILWPAVAEVCRKEIYTFVPHLFATAEELTVGKTNLPSPDEFEQGINTVLAEQYTQLGDIRRGQDKNEEAVEHYTAALEKVEDYLPALAGREKSYYKIGKSDLSKQDRDRLRELEDAGP